MKDSEKLKFCVGCRDNMYNYPGNYGGSGGNAGGRCWKMESMKIVKKKRIPIWMSPPWDMPAKKVASCYSQKGYVFVDEKVTC